MTVASMSTPLTRPPARILPPRITASLTKKSMRSTASLPINEPSGAFASRGSPATRVPALRASLSANSSATDASTMMRSVDMQIWPWFMNALNAAALTASSRSASSSTTKGALPPSSSNAGLRCRAAISATTRPTRVEPVKFTRRTTGALISASTIVAASAGALVTTFTTPPSIPASLRIFPISPCVTGHISEAFRTTVLPQASGMATARIPRMTGAFHGAIPRTTPTGWRTPIASSPGRSDGMISPAICVVIAAASRSMLAARCTLK